MYLIRLDDASEYMDVERWRHVECVLDKHGVKPLVGIIPENHDPKFLELYDRDDSFWQKARSWATKGWTIAMHGWHHVYTQRTGGINAVNFKSEFAGVPFEEQCRMIRDGISILKENGLAPTVFFAPSHTYDSNTVEALRRESDIRVISDTVANDVYFKDGFHFVPVQSGQCRTLPLRMVTICLHPNVMSEDAFQTLDSFLSNKQSQMSSFCDVTLSNRERTFMDEVLQKLYFFIKRVK